jgi:hypothetical protein
MTERGDRVALPATTQRGRSALPAAIAAISKKRFCIHLTWVIWKDANRLSEDLVYFIISHLQPIVRPV